MTDLRAPGRRSACTWRSSGCSPPTCASLTRRPPRCSRRAPPSYSSQSVTPVVVAVAPVVAVTRVVVVGGRERHVDATRVAFDGAPRRAWPAKSIAAASEATTTGRHNNSEAGAERGGAGGEGDGAEGGDTRPPLRTAAEGGDSWPPLRTAALRTAPPDAADGLGGNEYLRVYVAKMRMWGCYLLAQARDAAEISPRCRRDIAEISPRSLCSSKGPQ